MAAVVHSSSLRPIHSTASHMAVSSAADELQVAHVRADHLCLSSCLLRIRTPAPPLPTSPSTAPSMYMVKSTAPTPSTTSSAARLCSSPILVLSVSALTTVPAPPISRGVPARTPLPQHPVPPP